MDIRITKRALLIACLVACTCSARGHAQTVNELDQTSSVEVRLAEAKSQWQSYFLAISHYEVELDLFNEWNRSIIDHEPETLRFRTVTDYPRSLVYRYHLNSDRVREVEGVNPEYCFRVSPVQDDPKQWIASSVARTPSPSPECQFSRASIHDVQSPYDAPVNEWLGYALAIHSVLLPSLVELDGFSVTSFEETTRDGQRIATLTYTYEPESMEGKVQVRSGTVHLLADHYWVVDSVELNVGAGPDPAFHWPFSIKNTYEFSGASIPLLKSSVWKCFNNTPDRTWRYSMTHTFRFQKTEDRSPERFTLTAFGLPEPEFETQPARYRLWLFVGSTLVAAIALYVIRSRRRDVTGQ